MDTGRGTDEQLNVLVGTDGRGPGVPSCVVELRRVARNTTAVVVELDVHPVKGHLSLEEGFVRRVRVHALRSSRHIKRL